MERLTKRNLHDFAIPTQGTDAFHLLQTVDRLATIEDILGDEYDLDRLKELVEAERKKRVIIAPDSIKTMSDINRLELKRGDAMKQSGHTQDTPTIPELIRYYEQKLTGTTMPGAVRMYQATLDYLKSIQISMDSLATERDFESEQEYINYLIRVIQNLQFANINRGRLIDRLEKEKPE